MIDSVRLPLGCSVLHLHEYDNRLRVVTNKRIPRKRKTAEMGHSTRSTGPCAGAMALACSENPHHVPEPLTYLTSLSTDLLAVKEEIDNVTEVAKISTSARIVAIPCHGSGHMGRYSIRGNRSIDTVCLL